MANPDKVLDGSAKKKLQPGILIQGDGQGQSGDGTDVKIMFEGCGGECRPVGVEAAS
ncbi:MAG: hypothetical protein BWZ07_00576 [Alphaproteobacteria bacterium ADurb.BinA280]|nr:MAG: hypothetical protein BWZ07_00576 [Alphaproteobacteria bacterium ADurb.BinA280]